MFSQKFKSDHGELHYALTSGATCIFFDVQTFLGNQTNAEESFDSAHPLAWTKWEISIKDIGHHFQKVNSTKIRQYGES